MRPALVNRLLALPLFTRREDITSAADIIKWWELRRIPYNIAVGTTGIFTCATIFVIAAIASRRFGEPLGLSNSPIFELLGVVAYAIVANVCFTGGWFVEIIVRNIWREKAGAFAEIAFSLGLVFSILLTLVPAVVLVLIFLLRLLLR
jgi:hypothetical protein